MNFLDGIENVKSFDDYLSRETVDERKRLDQICMLEDEAWAEVQDAVSHNHMDSADGDMLIYQIHDQMRKLGSIGLQAS